MSPGAGHVKRVRRFAARRGEQLRKTRDGRWFIGSEEIDFDSYSRANGLDQAYGERRLRARARTIPRLAKGIAVDIIEGVDRDRPRGMPAKKYDRIKELTREAAWQIVNVEIGDWLNRQSCIGEIDANGRKLIERLIDHLNAV